MRIVIVGKMPPIEGGVGASTYWAARDLVARGHTVHLVSNAGEVEPGFRELLLEDDQAFMQSAGESLHVHTTTSTDGHSHTPWSNPYGSKLFGLAARIIEERGCDLVFGWYFEPYALVAATVAKVFGKPVVVRHAGSDLGRLSRHPDLSQSYRWMLKSAAAVLTSSRAGAPRDLLLELGAVEPQIRTLPISRLPDVHLAESPLFDVSRFPPAKWSKQLSMPADLMRRVAALNSRPFNYDLPTIGVYGKVGEAKGSYDLVEALSVLASKGLRFNFVAIAAGTLRSLAEYYESLLGAEPLAKRTWVLPPIAPWRIPSFLRSCDIACCLEREFPVAFHTPSGARETLAAGACLVVSEEIARKQPFSESLSDFKNCVIVSNPRDTAGLASRLERLLEHPEMTRTIGKHGYYLSKTCEGLFSPSNATADAIEEVGRQLQNS